MPFRIMQEVLPMIGFVHYRETQLSRETLLDNCVKSIIPFFA